uniref:Uncharacterized protein n=2 Tax=Anguilla anguilla TaxID=7936 RepID=A0A0E9SY93_ANGAN
MEIKFSHTCEHSLYLSQFIWLFMCFCDHVYMCACSTCACVGMCCYACGDCV